MKIDELRNQINEIDGQLVRLFCARMETAKKIAEYKKENSLPVLDREREKAVLERLSSLAGNENAPYVCELYEKIFEISRRSQQGIIGSGNTEEKK
jgi:monofunctional chorismate mutase